jgi:hypothetical protein
MPGHHDRLAEKLAQQGAFSAPSTFRTPTSAARFEDEDVDRFMKLMQAISKVRMAMEASINRDVLLPPGVTLSLTPER